MVVERPFDRSTPEPESQGHFRWENSGRPKPRSFIAGCCPEHLLRSHPHDDSFHLGVGFCYPDRVPGSNIELFNVFASRRSRHCRDRRARIVVAPRPSAITILSSSTTRFEGLSKPLASRSPMPNTIDSRIEFDLRLSLFAASHCWIQTRQSLTGLTFCILGCDMGKKYYFAEYEHK